MKLFRRFRKIIYGYGQAKDYMEVLTSYFSELSKEDVITRRKITNTSVDDTDT